MASDLQVTISASVKGLIEGLEQASHAVRENTSEWQERFGALGEMVEKIKAPFAAAVAALAGGHAFKEIIHEAVEYEEQIAKLGRVMGVGAEEASVWHNALKRISVESGNYELAIYRVQIALRTQEAALNANGVKTRDALGNHLSINDVMEEGIQRVQELTAGYDRNALAQLMFGRSAKELEELQRLNATRIQEAREQVEKLGIAVTESGAERMYEYKAAMAGAQTVLDAFSQRIGFVLIPVLTSFAKTFQEIGPVLINAIVPAFQAFAAILESTTFKLVAAAGVLRYVVYPAYGAITGAVLKLVDTLRVQYALGVAEAMSNSMKFTQALNTTGAAASQLGIVAGPSLVDKFKALGGAVAGLINPWVLLAGAIIGGAFAIERYLTAEQRAAKARQEETEKVASHVEKFNELSAEAKHWEEVINDTKSTEGEVARAKEHLATIMRQLSNMYPEYNDHITDESGRRKTLSERVEETRQKIVAEMRTKLDSAELDLTMLEGKKKVEDARRAAADAEHQETMEQMDDLGMLGAWAIGIYDMIKEKWSGAKYEDYTSAIESAIENVKKARKNLEDAETPPKKEGDTFVDANNLGRFQLWRNQLEDIKAMEGNWFTWSTQRELEFWRAKLGQTVKGSGEYAAVLRVVNDLRKKSATEEHEGRLTEIKTELDDKNRSNEERLAIAMRLVAEELRIHREGSKEVMDARRKVAEVIRQNAERDHEVSLQKAREQANVANRFSKERLDALRVEIAEEVRMHGEGSAEVAAARRKLAQAEKEIDLDRKAAAISAANGIRDAQRMVLDQMKRDLQSAYDMGETFWKTDALEQEKVIAAQELEIARAEIAEKMKDEKLGEEQRQELRNKEIAAYAKYAGTIRDIDKAIMAEHMRIAGLFIQPFVSGFERGFAELLKGHLSVTNAIKGIWNLTLDSMIQGISKLVAEWVAQGLKMLANWIILKGKELLVHETTEVAKTEATVAGAGVEVGANAAKAGSAATATAAETPGIGWAIAIPAGLAVVAAVLGLRALIGSAAQGWDLPQGGPFPAVLHSEEMVLPQNIANPLRRAIGSGEFGDGKSGQNTTVVQQGDTYHVSLSISATDAEGLDRVLHRRKGTIVRIVEDAIRNNRIKVGRNS